MFHDKTNTTEDYNETVLTHIPQKGGQTDPFITLYMMFISGTCIKSNTERCSFLLQLKGQFSDIQLAASKQNSILSERVLSALHVDSLSRDNI